MRRCGAFYFTMRTLAFLLLLSLAGSVRALASLPPAPELPVETFFGNPALSQLQFSPNGRYLAALVPHQRRMNLVVMDLDTKSKKLITSFSDFSISVYQWANDDRLLLLMDDDGDEDFVAFAIDRDGRNFDKLDDTKAFSAIESRDRDNPRRVLVYSNQTHRDRPDPCWLDVKTGRVSVITRNPGNVTSWVVDHDHVPRFGLEGTTEGLDSAVLYRDGPNGEWRRLAVFRDGEPYWQPLAFDADNRTIYIASNEGRRTAAVYRYDTATHTRGELVFGDPNDRYDVADVVWSDVEKRIVAVNYTSDRDTLHVIDETYGKRQQLLDEALPGHINRQVAATSDGRRIVVLSRSDREPGVYYLLDQERRKIEEIAVTRPEVVPDQMAPMKAIRYQARDGLEIEALLTLPVGIEPKGLPLVINPHGGPFGPRDEWAFNPEVQFLANRGFAVMQPNYRGSGGYGDWFERRGYRQWGRAMQDDLTDAVNWAVAQGIADPKRVVIIGASYGGYAAMAGAAFTPELYCAAVNYVGVTDLLLIAKQGRATDAHKAWRRTRIGDLYDDAEELRARSPVFFADQIQIPVLMAYGKADPRVTREHGDDMRAALSKAGKQFEFTLESGEGHGFRKEEKSIAFYTRVDAFLKRHVPGVGRGDSMSPAAISK